MILRRFKSAHREKAIWFLLASAQLSMAAMLVLENLVAPWLPPGSSVDFICGMLTGYAIVGNLGFLACSGPLLKGCSKERVQG